MTEQKHTPGPWKLGHNDGTFVEIDAPTHGALATTVWCMEDDKGFGSPECEANARLIAAAPEGYELAKEFLEFARGGNHFFYPPGSMQKLEQFVAKVEGR